MARRIAIGIDVGTKETRVVVVEEVKGPDGPVLRVIGSGCSPTSGLRRGYVVDMEDAAESIRAAKEAAEAGARIPIRSCFLAVGGISLDEARATGETVISRADAEITELDVEKTRESARQAAAPGFANRKVLHEIPLEFRIDGAKVFGEPVGMKGTRLEGDYLFVTCLDQHLDALREAVESADIEVLDHMASPLAGSYVTLTKDQKMKGCVLANIGAETVSIVVYDEGIPLSVKVFPVGSGSITSDLALAFKVSLEDAERIKLGRLSGAMYPRKKVDEIVTTRLRTLFDAVDKHLKALGRRAALPAGILLSGGGAGQSAAADVARSVLALPARAAELRVSRDSRVRDATWAVAYGLALWGLTGDTETPRRSFWKRLVENGKRFLRQFLP